MKLDVQFELNYKDIPHFPVSTVESHSGKFIFGFLGDKAVMAMQGRFHRYEGLFITRSDISNSGDALI